MNYTEKEQEYIQKCFYKFFRKVIKYKAINLWKEQAKYAKHFVSYEKIAGEYSLDCGEWDIYPILQYHFEAWGYIFSINDYRLGKALSEIEKKKRDIVLMYYFTNLTLTQIAKILDKSRNTISSSHIRTLHKLRKIMEADNEKI